jgi:hypothetical protein
MHRIQTLALAVGLAAAVLSVRRTFGLGGQRNLRT